MYRNVIVGTDGSDTAGAAVRHAAGVAVAAGARLIVVTAYQPDTDAEEARAAGAPEEVRWELTDGAEADRIARTAKDQAREQGVDKVVVRAERGRPAEAILEASREFDADLIVVGSVGMTSSARFLMGSVANAITHRAPCDVLVVRTET
ncbi:MAG TPA: universal stress protein [Acidimicrobiales bacterium]|jgi:nucleotide-binding universal stress UspA family protein